MLPKNYPCWQTVYGYFRAWKQDKTWEAINDALRETVRLKNQQLWLLILSTKLNIGQLIMIKDVPRRNLYLLSLIIGLTILVLSLKLLNSNATLSPTLVVMETTNNRETCILSLIEPNKRKMTDMSSLSSSLDHCYISPIIIDSMQMLASYNASPFPSVQDKNHIVLYQYDQRQAFREYFRFQINNITITSRLIGKGQKIFFSGIEDEVEQIFEVDITTNELKSIVKEASGFPENPTISSDGRFIAYELVEGNYKNNLECRQACQKRHYVVWDSQTFERSSILLATPEFTLICKAQWNPTLSFFVFETGCGVQDDNQIVLYNPIEKRIVKQVYSAEASKINLRGWVGDESILFRGNSQIDNKIYDGYVIYNFQTDQFEAVNFPTEFNQFSVWFDKETVAKLVSVRNVDDEIESYTLDIFDIKKDALKSIALLEKYKSAKNLRWADDGLWLSFEISEERSTLQHEYLGVANTFNEEVTYFKINNLDTFSYFWIPVGP